MNNYKYIWVFQGNDSDSPSGLFSSRSLAEDYIEKYLLSGLLTSMPLNNSIYDWSIKENFFSPTKDYQKSSTFIQKFNSAYLDHFHYENGICIS